MLAIERENYSPSPGSSFHERATFQIEHILAAQGIPSLPATDVQLLLALNIFDTSKTRLGCCAQHVKENRSCHMALSDNSTAVGLFTLCRVAENLGLNHQATMQALTGFAGCFLCSQKHKNDTEARRRLVEVWAPVILQHQEESKRRILGPVEQKMQELQHEGDMLYEKHGSLERSIEDEVERRVEQRLVDRIQEVIAQATAVIAQKDQQLQEQEEALARMNEEFHGTIQNLLQKIARQE